MLQFEARSRVTLVAGVSGSGKSSFALRYLVADRRLACRFVFDPEGEFAARLRLPAAENPVELICAIEDGWGVFDPHAMFPGRLSEAFAWFCGWVFERGAAGAGRKILLVDEAWKYCTTAAIPFPLANVIQTGRKRGLESMFCTQRPNRLNEAITNEVTELVCFRLQGANALRRVEELGVNAAEASGLALGEYLALDVNSGGRLRGKVF